MTWKRTAKVNFQHEEGPQLSAFWAPSPAEMYFAHWAQAPLVLIKEIEKWTFGGKHIRAIICKRGAGLVKECHKGRRQSLGLIFFWPFQKKRPATETVMSFVIIASKKKPACNGFGQHGKTASMSPARIIRGQVSPQRHQENRQIKEKPLFVSSDGRVVLNTVRGLRKTLGPKSKREHVKRKQCTCPEFGQLFLVRSNAAI